MKKKRDIKSIKHYICCLLLLSGFTWLLPSCEQEEDITDTRNVEQIVPATGEPVTVHFTVGERHYGYNNAVTRNAQPFITPPSLAEIIGQPLTGSPEKRDNLVGEEGAVYIAEGAAVLVSEDIYLSASIQEGIPAVRLHAAPLDPGMKIRVAAYDILSVPNDTILLTYADYEIDAGYNAVPDGTLPMTVPSGNILFVAYSFNDNIPMPAFADTIPAIGARDLLWGDTAVTVGPGNTNVHIILDHLFSKIIVTAETVFSPPRNINAIYGARYDHTFPALAVRSGNLRPGDPDTVSIAWQTAVSAPSWLGGEYFVYTNGGPPIVRIDSVSLNSTIHKHTLPPWMLTYTPLEAGKEYTIFVRFMPQCVPITNVLISSVPASGSTMLTGETIYLTANPDPSGATNVSYQWQYHDGITWVTISTTTTPTFSATIMEGFNQFRVIASNSCSSAVTSTTPITATGVTPAGGSASRITWDDANEQYALTTDPRDAGLYFRYGSVVGIFSGAGRYTQDLLQGTNSSSFNAADHVTINFTTVTISGAANVPFVNSGNINAAYHTAANVKAGLGDPCRLVGLDLNNIKNKTAGQLTAAEIDNFTWRLPTGSEQQQFSGYSTQQTGNPGVWWWNLNQNPSNFTLGVPGGEFPERNHVNGGPGKFLPAVGDRNAAGTVVNQRSRGYFLSSTPGNFGNFMGFQFGSDVVNYPNAIVTYFWPARCVPQAMVSTSVTPSSISLPYPAQNPAVQTISVTSDGAWTLTVPGSVTWLSLNTNGSSSGSSTVSGGAGVFTVYLVATANFTGAPRTGNIELYGLNAVVVTQDPCIQIGSVSLNASPAGSPPGTYPVGTPVTITATTNPLNATDVTYTWEFNSGSGWTVMQGNSGNILAVTATPTSTQYRVSASNACTSSLPPSSPVTVTGSGYPPDDKGTLPGGNVLSYVGAFWKASETGERVIRIDMGDDPAQHMGNWGPWSAVVAEYDDRWGVKTGADPNDGIMFAAGGSEDPNIYQASPGNAENYTLATINSPYSAFVSGSIDPQYTGNSVIEFRIFPQKTFTSTGKFKGDDPGGNTANDANYTTTWPARYAVVYLTYGSSPVKRLSIFLRQGEGSDYVMYDEGFTVPSYNHPDGTKRPQTKKFSPYNLSDVNTGTDYNMITELPVRGGSFTGYPTQGGYYFMHNHSRRAFNPYTPVIANYPAAPSVSNWNAALHETCPPGYKRPSDGPNATLDNPAVASSEIRQSLFRVMQVSSSPSPANLTWGYYADGYFDRRTIVYPTAQFGNPEHPTTVSEGTREVAFSGIIFYSTRTLASVFLPSAGGRQTAQSGGSAVAGTLERHGYWGYYATTTLFAEPALAQWGKYLRLGTSSGPSTLYLGGSFGGYGRSVRCVRE